MKNLRIGVVFTIVSALLLAPAEACADPVTRVEVERALGGYEQGPDMAAIRQWGAAGRELLMQIGRDATALTYTRARALHALRAFPGELSVRAFLRATAAASGDELFVLRACLDALVEGFDDAGEVARYLGDPRVDVRDGAAWSLANSRNPVARAALVERLRVEADPTVRTTLTQAIARNGAPPVATAPTPFTAVNVTIPARTPVVRSRAAGRR